jgi:hypothetical protein
LGDAAATAAWTAGQALTLDQAVDEALDEPDSTDRFGQQDAITARISL